MIFMGGLKVVCAVDNGNTKEDIMGKKKRKLDTNKAQKKELEKIITQGLL